MDRATSLLFRDLLAWQKAHASTLTVRRLTDSFPR
ncbi:MAG: four helix bundle protein [Verrucomicrobia bacterium]|nr:MAG: four helix bundle protein [Verrucomicrobiota bacterium]